MAQLAEVFGISSNVDSPSYVDRGGLDEKFRKSLASDRHVAVHGGSKQGKSWLRTRGLKPADSIVVQCTPSSTTASLFREALGRLGVQATLSVSKSRELTGTLNFSGAVDLGKLLAKLRAEGNLGGAFSSAKSTEYQPIGKTEADLLWVAQTFAASNKTLVLEDFHYLDEKVQKDFAFLIKALGEYGATVVIIGVWPKDHMLTYYNGDLDGRVDDIHLSWTDDELTEVLTRGAAALNLKFTDELIAALVGEAYGSVGLIQRLAEQLCMSEGIHQSVFGRPRVISKGESFDVATSQVAQQMQGRFQSFADNFVRGMRRLNEGLEVYRHLLQEATVADDGELINGLDSAVLLRRIGEHPSGAGIRQSDLTQALIRIDRLQVRINVNPLVLTYGRSSRALYLADRSFLFYRKHGDPHWPWSDEDSGEITNDLAEKDPLALDDVEP